MPTLDVPGASLSYETHGSGPLIVFIPGGQGTGDVYHPIATALAAKYTSVTYDRRGFSASILTSDGTAVVFGSSSGAIVALFLLLSYPESIRTVIPHEPPAIDLQDRRADSGVSEVRREYVRRNGASNVQTEVGDAHR
ncbi:alpha/beta-hydrolase [Dacryopinax primogenitus]|uniref:Alpha/beta-hydrolase n=1 Tax=Dacryopinax primogenitus (strain DJM 731) TaxID=1858805 RepID=M5G874_DACPD|nr:alpha/beta-hydrolase [Dacryopinax primogenitus]EJU06416.1 alpha/beta-hydrolase [Dacryopinax primogenitus]